jgi:Mg2+ and Co2+ transporter CorA
MSKVFSNKKISNTKMGKKTKIIAGLTVGTIVSASLIFHINKLQKKIKELEEKNEMKIKELNEKDELIRSMISRYPDKTTHSTTPKNNKELKKQEEEFTKRYNELRHNFEICDNTIKQWVEHDNKQKKIIDNLTNEHNIQIQQRFNALKRQSKKVRKVSM